MISMPYFKGNIHTNMLQLLGLKRTTVIESAKHTFRAKSMSNLVKDSLQIAILHLPAQAGGVLIIELSSASAMPCH